MNYKKIYKDLIDNRLQNPIPKIRVRSKQELCDGFYTETHHIIPKCINGTNDKNNLVELTAREHFIAHKLLFKACIGTSFEIPLANAYWEMCYCHKDKAYKINKSSRQFAREKKQMLEALSKSQKGRIKINNGKHTKCIKPDDLQQYLSNGYVIGTLQIPWNKGRHDLPPSWISGKHHTLETRVKISVKCKDIKMPNSMKQKTRNRMLGNKQCCGRKRHDYELKHFSESMQNRIRINNGINNKFVKKTDLQQYLNNGWKIGGKPLSEEHKKRLSQANIGKLKGKPSPHKGKKYSKKHRQNIAKSKLGKRWYNNGNINVFIFPENVPIGFKPGLHRKRNK